MFLRSFSTLDEIFLNILFMILWYLICFFACITLSPSVYCNKRKYKPRKWENGGKWYDEKLHIKKWKDKLPQYIGKNGFSKRHLEGLSADYIDTFIKETCRAEWSHSLCALYAIITFVISDISIAIEFSVLTLAIHLPFLAIQRYNRFRLIKLKNRINRKAKKEI